MKRKLLIGLLLLAIVPVYAQHNMLKVTKGNFSSYSSIYGYTDYQLQNLLKEKDKLKTNKVKLRTITSYNGGLLYQTIQTFDAEGRIAEIKRTSKGRVNCINYTFDSQGNIIKI